MPDVMARRSKEIRCIRQSKHSIGICNGSEISLHPIVAHAGVLGRISETDLASTVGRGVVGDRIGIDATAMLSQGTVLHYTPACQCSRRACYLPSDPLFVELSRSVPALSR